MEIKVDGVALNNENKYYIKKFIQTGNKKEDIKVNKPEAMKMTHNLFEQNDLSKFQIITNIPEDILKKLATCELPSNIVYRDTLLGCGEHFKENNLLIDCCAEVIPEYTPESAYLITFQIPYPKDTPMEYEPKAFEENQVAYIKRIIED